MASEQFLLCWDNFHKNMCKGMSSLLEHEDLVDVTLAVEGQYLKAHKMVLSVCSPYFKQLFKVNPCKHPIVFMKDVSYIAMSDLLQFMYHGQVHVSQENLPTFLKTAEALQITGLTGDGNVSNKGEKHAVAEISDEKHAASPKTDDEEQENAISLKMEPYEDPESSTLADDDFELYDHNDFINEEGAMIEEEEEEGESKPGTSAENLSTTLTSIAGLISANERQDSIETGKISEGDTVPHLEDLLPPKSRYVYEATYKLYQKWRSTKKIKKTDEDTILMYFTSELSKYKSSSLWSKYSMLRSTIHLHEGVNISKFPNVIRLLKCKSKDYKPKQSLSLTKNLLNEFLMKADNRTFIQ